MNFTTTFKTFKDCCSLICQKLLTLHKLSIFAMKILNESRERLLEVVIRFGRDVVVRQESEITMHGEFLPHHLAILDVNLVSTKYNRNIGNRFTKIINPDFRILIGNTRCHVEHDNRTFGSCEMIICKSIFLLSSKVRDTENNLSLVSRKEKRFELHSLGCDGPLLELPSYVSSEKSGLAHSSITNENEFVSVICHLI